MMADNPEAAVALDRVRRLAKQDQVEVEDLLALVRVGDSSVIPVLLAFKALYGWPQRGRIPGSPERFVPLGRWADYVCNYLGGGFDRIAALALDPEEQALEREDGTVVASLAFGVLAHIRSAEAVTTSFRIGAELDTTARAGEASLRECLNTLNTLLCFDPQVKVDSSTSVTLRDWIHSLLELHSGPATVALAYCVLREVGDESSICLMEGRPPLPDPWRGLEQNVARRIRSRSSREGADGTLF